ncbi:MAG: hypothetical protein ACE5JF_05995 [Anaerolineales bacterium]
MSRFQRDLKRAESENLFRNILDAQNRKQNDIGDPGEFGHST